MQYVVIAVIAILATASAFAPRGMRASSSKLVSDNSGSRGWAALLPMPARSRLIIFQRDQRLCCQHQQH